MASKQNASSAAATVGTVTAKRLAIKKPTVDAPVSTKKMAVKSGSAKKVAAKSASASVVAPVAIKPLAAETQLKVSTAPKPVISVEQRNHYVSVAAFYIAERRGFTLGNPQDDWLAAEVEVDRLIASGHFVA